MELVLKVVAYNGVPPPVAASVTVSDESCVVGRHPDCQLELPDPECAVSGRHALIGRHHSGFAVTDLDSTNGTFVNDSDAPIAPKQPIALHDGDTITIGPYVLSVGMPETQGAALTDPFATNGGAALPGIPDPRTSPDIMELLGPASKDQLSPGQPQRPLEAIEPRRPSVENIHFNVPAGPKGSAQVSGAPEVPAESGQPLVEADAGLSPAGIPGEDEYDLLSDAFKSVRDVDGSSGEAPSSQVSGAEATDRVAREPADFADQPSPAEQQFPDTEPTTTGAHDAETEDAKGRESERHADTRPAQPVARRGLATESNAELAAFLAGLGIGDPADVHDSEAMLRLSGQLLRAMTEGLMAVMMARASFKSELRLEVTTIRSQDNNPFQFCVDPDDALERLLWRRSRGFLDPAAAVSKTFDDIQAHQMAMIAGLRAAMRAMLARFQPEELEKHFERQSHLDKLLPMARKSKCWDLFVSTFDQVASDASEDFMRLFGDAFNRAYDDQVQRLMAAKHVGSS